MALFRDLQKPRGLTRKPIYWNPEKEEREERERRIREELGIAEDDTDNLATYRPNIKGQFRSASIGNRDELRKLKQKSVRKMLLLMLILGLLLYLIVVAYPFLELFLEQYY
ncbi:MAG: hypothetical protein KGV44_09500 [Flavobacteriaceae bacterium]|nr:hypothetical protein [Flavobacteriaceae bacterium]